MSDAGTDRAFWESDRIGLTQKIRSKRVGSPAVLKWFASRRLPSRVE
jgi:hypothetical protein